MRDLVSTWAPCRVEVKGIPGEHLVYPPTVKQAVTVIAAIESLQEEDSLFELRRIAFEWLPSRLASTLFVREANPMEIARGLGSLLSVGIIDRESHKEKAGRTKKKARDTSWFEVFAEYRTTFNADPTNEPWAYFVAMCTEMWKMQAREQLRNVHWYAAAKTGKTDDIMKRAGIKKSHEDFDVPEVMTDPKWSEEQIQKAKNLGKLMRQKKGEA